MICRTARGRRRFEILMKTGSRFRGEGPSIYLCQLAEAKRQLRERIAAGHTETAVISNPSWTEAHGRGLVCARIYSVRNASTGEMHAARLAGIRAANRAQMANALAALSANGSQLATP